MIDLSEYESLARETGAFKDIELEILKESLLAWQRRPGAPYSSLELRDGKILAGFAVLCREGSTDHTFDLQALCIEPSYVDKGVTAGLLGMVEDEILSTESSAILRFETSKRKEAAMGSGILAERGFALIGHIPDFYATGDDYYMYAKHLRRGSAEEGAETEEGR
jgi:hypothetical protein